MKFLGFIGSSYKLNNIDADTQRTINLYPEMNESGLGKEQEVASLVSTPACKLLVDLGAGPIRGEYRTSTNRLFVVSGDTLYEISSAFAQTNMGTLVTSTGNVSMVDNGIDLCIVDGDNGYFLTLASNAFAQIVDPDFLGADKVEYIDGYFIFNKPDSGQFYITNLNSTVIDALDIATSEGKPDKIVSLIADHRDLWIFNEYSTEVFANTGDEFPFTRTAGAFIEHGCAAAFSVAKINNRVIWLGRDEDGHGVVYMAQGLQPQKISTNAIDQAIQGYSSISDAKAFVYQQGGHHFYVLNFPTADTTWVFDTSTNQWHERAYFSEGALFRHRADCHAFAFGKHIVGDYENGNLYELSSDYFYDDVDGAKTILRRRITPYISAGLKGLTHHSLQVDIVTGVGTQATGQGHDPTAMLRFSDDGGRTWSNEKTAEIGKLSKRGTRVIFRRLGYSRARIYEFSVTDPVPVTLLGAEIEVEAGAS
jgi:hypothetical protein